MSAKTGINELMDDLGKSLNEDPSMMMLGGGNPAGIPEVESILKKRMHKLLNNQKGFEKMIGIYDTPQGNKAFIVALADLFNSLYQWNLTPDNIAVTNGSQSAFFYLFNMLGGRYDDGSKGQILFPMVPEYIGYTDQAIEEGIFKAQKPKIDIDQSHSFKYGVDFERLSIGKSVRAMCVSRPTNPSGNVLTNTEMNKLSKIAKKEKIHLIIDNAYGAPFPNIIYSDVKPIWDKHIILSLSLSKIGLPSTRTGIIIARKEIISALSQTNAVVSLSTGSIGAHLTLDLIKNKKIISMSNNIVKPFYRERAETALELTSQYFDDELPYFVHKCEGSMFLWMWFKDLPITSKELYERLKKRKVLVVSGHYFFPGFNRDWKHKQECIRINYAYDPVLLKKGLKIIAEEVRKAYQAG